MKLEGKIALVTGSSRGIGKAMAEAFSREGASVVVTYKKNSRMAKKIAQDLNYSLVVKLDISSRANIINVVKQIMKKYGRYALIISLFWRDTKKIIISAIPTNTKCFKEKK